MPAVNAHVVDFGFAGEGRIGRIAETIEVAADRHVQDQLHRHMRNVGGAAIALHAIDIPDDLVRVPDELEVVEAGIEVRAGEGGARIRVFAF